MMKRTSGIGRLLAVLLPVLLLRQIATADIYTNPRTADIPTLIKALEDANVRQGASIALARLGRSTVPALRKTLAGDKGDLRLWTAYTLGKIGPGAAAAVPELTQALSAKDASLRAVAARSLGQIGVMAGSAVPTLAETLRDKDQRVRRFSAIALGRIGPAASRAVPKLIRSLKVPGLRTTARDALIRIGRPALPALQNVLTDNAVRFDAISTIRQIDPQAARRAGIAKPTAADLPALRIVLLDTGRSVADRRVAATALGSLGPAAIAPLIAAFSAEAVSQSASAAVGRIGVTAVPQLVKALADDRAAVRATAADALAAIGPPAHRAVKGLIAAFKDRDRTVRHRAVLAVDAFGPSAAEAVPALIVVVNNPRDREETRQAALKALVRTGEPKSRSAVVEALIHASQNRRNFGISSLARQLVRKLDPTAAAKAGIK